MADRIVSGFPLESRLSVDLSIVMLVAKLERESICVMIAAKAVLEV